MPTKSSITRVSVRDGATLDWIAERGGTVSIVTANLKAQKQYDRLAQRGWVRIEAKTLSLTPEGHRAQMSAKVQALRKRPR